jgi:hypothetical protein
MRTGIDALLAPLRVELKGAVQRAGTYSLLRV